MRRWIPRPLKQGLKHIYGAVPPRIRLGREFWETYDSVQESQWWSKERLQEYQMRELRKLLRHAYMHVPYFRRLFDERGLKPDRIEDLSDFRKIPLLTKECVIDNFSDLTATNFPSASFIKASTGGSSGIPLAFLYQKGFTDEREAAFIAALWDRVGFRYGTDKRLVLRGAIVDNIKRMDYDPASRELICSTYWMDDVHLKTYMEEMAKKRIRFIHGHVSSVVNLAQYILQEGKSCELRAVLGASEKVYPFQRKLVRDAFHARLYSWYGHSERAVLAGECELSQRYHVFSEYGLMELIDEEGNCIETPGQKGEIVATGFNNYAMPFIRYRTGDIAEYASESCECGREYSLLEDIEGRSYDYILSGDGRRISLTGLIFGQHFKAFERIKKMQLYQDRQGEMEIRIVEGPGYTKQDEEELRQTIEKAVGSGLRVAFSYCDDIPRTASGKHQFLIQKLEF